MKRIDGSTVELDASLKKVLNRAEWVHMKVSVNNNGTTRILLSSKRGEYARLLLDYDSKLLDYQMHSIDL